MTVSEKVSLPERVEHLYYSHGLLCSSYPMTVLSIAITIILICCYPLLNLPLPGNVPIQTYTEAYNFTMAENLTVFTGPPSYFIQQIVIKTGVSPWTEDLALFDAFRAPLSQVFNLIQIMSNYQHKISNVTLSDICLHIEAVKLKSSDEQKLKILPEYSCLVVSPANFWQQNYENFQQDAKLLNTIFSYHNFQKGKISLSEILFGVNMKESGMRRYPLRSRPRTIQYAVTIVFQSFDHEYIKGLRSKLESAYPLHKTPYNETNRKQNEMLHVYYPGETSFHEFIPLTLTCLMLYMYIYFSVRKVELIKSKVGIAISAVLTIISSLFMSVGLCFFFGLTLSLSGKEIFPYSVIVVGLENVLVITKSITSVPAHLDVKIRVAQGLSREGWSITKNLLVEVTILTIGIFTFVPNIQHICIFAIVGIACDFFLQMFFFTTVLSIDIHRMDKQDANQIQHKNFLHNPLTDKSFMYNKSYRGLSRSKSHHNLTSISTVNNSYPANIVAPTAAPILNKLPKRLRLVNFWASTRFLQRALMIALVTWMCFILYSSGFVQQLFRIDEIAKFHEKLQDSKQQYMFQSTNSQVVLDNMKDLTDLIRDDVSGVSNVASKQGDNDRYEAEERHRFRFAEQDPYRRLSLYHWPALLSLYNISLADKFITILPAIRLSHIVSPSHALDVRNPNEVMERFHWKNLAIALDPLVFTDTDGDVKQSLLPNYENTSELPIIPRSPMELALASILVVVSLLVLSYTTMALYRCICTRNYAEWRSSWEEEENVHETGNQVVLEAVAMTLNGHDQEVECLSTDGYIIVSSCLGGRVKVWNATCGEMISQLDRRNGHNGGYKIGLSDTELNHSDYESGSPPSRGDTDDCKRRKVSGDLGPVLEERRTFDLFDLKPHISTNFSHLKLRTNQRTYKDGFEFGSQYKMLAERRSSDDEVSASCCNIANECDVVCSEVLEDCPSAFSKYTEGGVFKVDELRARTDEYPPTIWCLDCMENLVVLGCCNGRFEFWEASTGHFKCMFEDGSNVGVTSIKLLDSRIVAARLNGSLDLLKLEWYNKGRTLDWGFKTYKRTHMRTGSAGSVLDWDTKLDCLQELRCVKVNSVRSHQQPITVLDCENNRVVTGSQDHTLKVLKLEDLTLLYTLHGHCGPITCMFIDRVTPLLSGSGSQDGLLCVWDLMTGACMYSIQAHDGCVTALTYSASYVISLGTDDRLCVWERFLGHLLNTIQVLHTYCSNMVMLTHNILITSKQGSLVLWDVRSGEPVRVVKLGNTDHSVYVKQIHHLTDSVVCDYGSQLRIVQFPIVSDKNK